MTQPYIDLIAADRARGGRVMSALPPRNRLSSGQRAVVDLMAGRTNSLSPEVMDQPAVRNELVQLCRAHRIHPIVAGLLRGANAPSSDRLQPLLDQLEADQVDRAVHLLGASRQLAELAQGLEERRIPFLALKGIALLGTVYVRQPLQRPFSDLDLLLRETQFDEAVAALLAMGYRPAQHKRDIEALRRYNRKLDFHYMSPRPCSLDVHFCLIGKKLFSQVASFDMNAIWQDARTRKCLGRPCLIPSPIHLLMHLALHLSLQHHLASLRWLYDLKVLIHSEPDLDWDQFVRTVHAARASRAVWLSLETATTLLEAAVPDTVREALAPAGLHRMDRVWMQSQQDPANILSQRYHYRQRRLPGRIWRMYSEVSLLDLGGRRSRVAAVAKWFFPDPWFLRVSYRVEGVPALVMCYLVHPWILLGMAGCLVALTCQQIWDLRRRERPLQFRPTRSHFCGDRSVKDRNNALGPFLDDPSSCQDK